MKQFKYCPYCMTPLEEKFVEGRDRKYCRSCNWINYLNPLPVISCLVSNEKKDLLVITRAVEPCIGCLGLPGGFVEIDETMPEAGVRELKEETGLTCTPGELIGVSMDPHPMYGTVLVVGYEFFYESGEIVAGDDAADAKFMPKEELPTFNFPSHNCLIKKYFSE